MADGSDKVVNAALLGNILVAVSKFIAAALSGSTALLTEGIHSTADCANQLLLMIGIRRGKLPADPGHQFGYGMEIYFWTFVVALLVMLAGGAYSIARGLAGIAHPTPIHLPWVNLAVLFFAALFEGASFSIGYGEYRRVASRHRIAGQKIGLIRFIQLSKDPSLYESLLEDGAALAGIVIAAAGVAASSFLGLLWADGAASLGIGLLLGANGIAILIATRSLIAGEAVAPALLQDLWSTVREHDPGGEVSDLSTLHLGPNCILISLMIGPGTAHWDRSRAVPLERRLKAVDPRIIEVMFRYDTHDRDMAR